MTSVLSMYYAHSYLAGTWGYAASARKSSHIWFRNNDFGLTAYSVSIVVDVLNLITLYALVS